jgi:hypothetical protein
MYMVVMVGIGKYKIFVCCVVISTYLIFGDDDVFLASHHPCVLIGVHMTSISVPLSSCRYHFSD